MPIAAAVSLPLRQTLNYFWMPVTLLTWPFKKLIGSRLLNLNFSGSKKEDYSSHWHAYSLDVNCQHYLLPVNGGPELETIQMQAKHNTSPSNNLVEPALLSRITHIIDLAPLHGFPSWHRLKWLATETGAIVKGFEYPGNGFSSGTSFDMTSLVEAVVAQVEEWRLQGIPLNNILISGRSFGGLVAIATGNYYRQIVSREELPYLYAYMAPSSLTAVATGFILGSTIRNKILQALYIIAVGWWLAIVTWISVKSILTLCNLDFSGGLAYSLYPAEKSMHNVIYTPTGWLDLHYGTDDTTVNYYGSLDGSLAVRLQQFFIWLRLKFSKTPSNQGQLLGNEKHAAFTPFGASKNLSEFYLKRDSQQFHQPSKDWEYDSHLSGESLRANIGFWDAEIRKLAEENHQCTGETHLISFVGGINSL